MSSPVVGVLALQGAFARHIETLRRVGVEATEVRTPAQLDTVDALVLPGGESSTMSKLLVTQGLLTPLADRLASGMPAFGTCAGMILLAVEVLDGIAGQASFGAIDLTVRRNGYGRQIDSFEADLDVTGVDGGPFTAVFIRAPVVTRVGPDVEVLAVARDTPVLVREGAILASSFHPELTDDDRLHRLFVDSI
ncbi:MAG: pyridoxal 5'-phosphate synthase glutaminase subunit PdxT [Acidimicrobiales bacterium]